MSDLRAAFVCVICLCGMLIAPGVLAAAKPQRIVSLNLCADQLVLLLASPPAVKSVTWLARDTEMSGVTTLASKVPVNYGLAEEIVPLQPDLVVASIYTHRTTVDFLKHLKIPILELDIPNSIAAMLAQVHSVAEALGERQKGEALVSAMMKRLAAIPVRSGSRPVAAVWQPNGATAGPGSLVDEVLYRAGLDNLAARPGITQYDRLPLEALILGHPDLLILNPDHSQLPALADELLRHRVVKAAFPVTRTVLVPDYLWTCGGPGVVEAVEILSRAAGEVKSDLRGLRRGAEAR